MDWFLYDNGLSYNELSKILVFCAVLVNDMKSCLNSYVEKNQ